MTTSPTLSPSDLLAGFILEDGRPWGAAAYDFQRNTATAILDPNGERRHYELRGRGMSKTTDVAAIVLALILTEAPARSRSHWFAVDHDQAALAIDAIAGIVARTPGLSGAVDLGAKSVTVKATGALLVIEPSDGASAFGLRPWLQVVDELSMWPSTQNHRVLWSAILSGQPKVPGSRLIVIGTAGPPAGLGAKFWTEAQKNPRWRTAVHPGPAPWWTEDDVADLKASLTASEYRRLILCEFAEGDDALTTPEDVAAITRAGDAVLEPASGREYVAALDVGTRRDLTGFAIGHVERRAGGRVVVIDRVVHWRPSRTTGGRVDLSDVEATVLRLCKAYRVRRLRFDRMQAEQLTSNVANAGVRCVEYVFSAAGANRLARSLYGAIRDRALEIPDDPELVEEANTARLVETAPGTIKLRNPPGHHDDVLTAVGMVVADLLEKPDKVGGYKAVNANQMQTAIVGDNAARRPVHPIAKSMSHRSTRSRDVIRNGVVIGRMRS